MRKHHVILCSVLSAATVAAQQPTTGGPQPLGSVAPSVSAAPSAPASSGTATEPVAPVAVETPAPIPAPGSTPSAATPTPTPTPLEVPAPIEPPAQIAPPLNVGAPGMIPPPVESASPIPAVPAIPGTVAPPVTEPVPAIQGVVAPPSGPGSIQSAAAASAALAVSANGAGVHDFQNEDMAQILRLLARQAKINVVVSDQITGTITMRLENKSPLEAMNVVVDAKGLTMEQRNGVYFIKTLAEKQKEPTESGNYTFSYAMAEKILPLLASQIQCGIAPQFDQRTNTVYFRDFKSNLENIKLFLESVDRPTQQVMIEARLVEITANPRQSYGINWAGTVGGSTNPQTFKWGGSKPGSADVRDTTHLDPTTGLPVQTTVISSLPSIPTSNSTTGGGSIPLQDFLFKGNGKDFMNAINGQFAILSAPQMSATLRLLNEDSDAEFLANPRIVTANNLKADIKITRNQPVPQLNFNEQTAQAVFGGFLDKEYGNTLTVTPTINKDDFVTLLVKPEISNKVGDASFVFGGANVSSPIIDKRTLESTVLIHSGDTLAIGGLLQDEMAKNRTKVPVLGDIPILGYAFQERINARVKRNLLVFVTPTIIREGYGTGLEDQVSGLKHSGEEYADPNGWRNNARGALRLKPTAQRPAVADYPKPGVPPAPKRKGVRHHVEAAPSKDTQE